MAELAGLVGQAEEPGALRVVLAPALGLLVRGPGARAWGLEPGLVAQAWELEPGLAARAWELELARPALAWALEPVTLEWAARARERALLPEAPA